MKRAVLRPPAVDYTPLNEPEIIYKAVRDGAVETLNYLICEDPSLVNHRCEINNKTLVETAVYFGQEEVLLYLLQFDDLSVSPEACAAYLREGHDPYIAERMQEKL